MMEKLLIVIEERITNFIKTRWRLEEKKKRLVKNVQVMNGLDSSRIQRISIGVVSCLCGT